MGQVTIYGLCDPRTEELRYIGATRHLRQRLNQHLHTDHGLDRKNWVLELRQVGLKPSVFVIEETDDLGWSEAERFWINYFRAIGSRLLNSCDGGDHPRYRSLEVKRRMSLAKMGHPVSAEARAKISAACLGYRHSPEAIEKIAQASRARRFSQETVEKRKSAIRECERKPDPHNTSGYRGVTRIRKDGREYNKWQASVRFHGKQIYIGLFDTPEEAAIAYNAKARELWGDSAPVNEVPR